MNLKLVLVDSTQIPLTNGNYINSLSTSCQTREQINYLWTKLNSNNTQVMKIYLGEQLIQIISNAIVNGVQIHEDPNDGLYLVTFNFYGATYSRDMDQEYSDAARILLGESE